MANDLRFTKKSADEFIELAMLSNDEAYILLSRMRGETVTQQALFLRKSEPTVHRMIKRIKEKYDMVQEEYPDRFPKRRTSKEEMYMDSH